VEVCRECSPPAIFGYKNAVPVFCWRGLLKVSLLCHSPLRKERNSKQRCLQTIEKIIQSIVADKITEIMVMSGFNEEHTITTMTEMIEVQVHGRP